MPKNFAAEPFCAVFQKFPVAKKFMDKRGGRESQDVPSKFFVSQCRKFPLGESFSVSLNSGIEKVWIRGGGGGVSRFSVEFFCLTVPKISKGEPFSVSLISGIEKFYPSEGNVTIFCRNFFVSQYRNIS